MPPFLIAAAVAALYFLIPKSKGKTIVKTQLPFGQQNYGAPLQSNSATSIPASNPLPVNTPSTSASGLPNSTSQTQQSAAQVTPPLASGNPYYNYSGLLSPNYVPTPVPSTPKSGCGGKCGGCSGCGGNSNQPLGSCTIASSRASNSGCLLPSRADLMTPSSIPGFKRWGANVASYPGATPFSTFEDFQSTLQNTSPTTEDVSPAVAPTSRSIGISGQKPQAPFNLVMVQ